jgi:hypothetical protein
MRDDDFVGWEAFTWPSCDGCVQRAGRIAMHVQHADTVFFGVASAM